MTFDRLPPFDLAAEESVVASLMVDAEAVNKVASILEPGDFFREANGWTYGACLALWDRNESINQVTVAHELDRRGQLEEVGGLTYLSDLVLNLPTSVGVEHYARIVKKDAVYRRLIVVANSIARIAYQAGPDLDGSLSQAESLLFGVKGGGTSKDFIHIREALDPFLDAASDQAVPFGGHVRTGLGDLDLLLGGLNPSDLVIVAARTGVGKTSLMLNFARNAAVGQHSKVAIFSLEMAAEQLAQRLLSSESRVDSKRLRLGLNSEAEEARIMHAHGILSQADIYIDDSAGVQMPELRAKLMRLNRDQRLDLVVVDYLQLIRGGERNVNRVQEISNITRSLKELARELDLPIVAGSQLSRATEQRQPHIPMLSDLRECVTGDTRLIDADTGQLVEIQALRKGQRVLGVGPSFRIAAGPVSDVWPTGNKPIFRLTTKSGRQIRATANHPFLTSRGWASLQDLTKEDRVAVAYRLPCHGIEIPQRAEQCRLLGYLMGNGSVQEYRTLGLIIPDQEAFDDASSIIKKYWPDVQIKTRANGYNDSWISRTYENGHGRPYGNPLREWLRNLGLIGERDRTKFVPDFVFEAGSTGAVEFLAGYFATDGCITTAGDGRWSIRFDTTSARLAQDVAHLLTKLGIAAFIAAPRLDAHARHPIHRIEVAQSPESLKRFADIIKPRGYRGRRLTEMARSLAARETRHNLLILPKELSTYAASVAPFRDQGKGLSRQRASKILDEVADDVLRAWIDSDFIWDGVRSIEPCGEEAVYDIRIPGVNSFLANGIAVHNSGSIEQDADVVLFIYREEMYVRRYDWQAMHPNEPYPQGKAQIIVAKHRNGPTGVIEVRFKDEISKFEDFDVPAGEPAYT